MTTNLPEKSANSSSPARLGGISFRLSVIFYISALAIDLQGTGFMTMLLAAIDSPQRQVRWANAGHDPILVYGLAKDDCFELNGADIPLGIKNDVRFDELVHPALKTGDVLLLGTDGIWEATNVAGEFYGKARLREAVRASAKDNAKMICDTIVQDIEIFRGKAAQRDDITFVVVKFVPVKRPVTQGTDKC